MGELASHFCNKYRLMVVKLQSKFDIRRLCKAVRAKALPKLVCTMHCPYNEGMVCLLCWLCLCRRLLLLKILDTVVKCLLRKWEILK